jgi:hypothetical protein
MTEGKVDPEKIYFGVVHKQSLTVIRVFISAEQARNYIKPLAMTGEYQIERVYLDPYVEKTYMYKLTWLDRPSCRSIREAWEQKKIERLRIWKPIHRRPSDHVLKDYRLHGEAKRLVECSKAMITQTGSNSLRPVRSSMLRLRTSKTGPTRQTTEQ